MIKITVNLSQTEFSNISPFLFLHFVQINPGAHPAAHPVGTRGQKQPGCEAIPLSPICN
jgi:hypothetical protein